MRFLEKARAGFGAAGLTAIVAEGVLSTKLLSRVFDGVGGVADFLIGLLSVAAFFIAAYIVDEK